MPSRLLVAILGGGLAGATLLNGLLQHTQLETHIFECRPAFKEEGAGIAFSYNAISVLRGINRDLLLKLDRAGAVKLGPAICFLAAGPNAGERLRDLLLPDDVDRSEDQRTVFRQAVLTQLFQNVPQGSMHPNN